MFIIIFPLFSRKNFYSVKYSSFWHYMPSCSEDSFFLNSHVKKKPGTYQSTKDQTWQQYTVIISFLIGVLYAQGHLHWRVSSSNFTQNCYKCISHLKWNLQVNTVLKGDNHVVRRNSQNCALFTTSSLHTLFCLDNKSVN